MRFSEVPADPLPHPPLPPQTVLGFDPGRDKCGVAVMRSGHPQPQLLYHQVILASEAVATLGQLLGRWQVEHLVLGNQTTANQWRSRLLQELQPCPPMSLVDERYTTLEARDRYWQMYPPQGLRRLVPQGMRQPPRPVDDIVAILLIERYWSQGSA